MICRMPAGNSGKMCGWVRPTILVVMTEQGPVNDATGAYVRHLIREHWELLVKVRESFEAGEIDLLM